MEPPGENIAYHMTLTGVTVRLVPVADWGSWLAVHGATSLPRSLDIAKNSGSGELSTGVCDPQVCHHICPSQTKARCDQRDKNPFITATLAYLN